MEIGTIEREVYIDASPEIVFEVVSKPEHVRQWWPDEARYDAVPGSSGEIAFGEPGAGQKVEAFTVLDVQPPKTFSFRWIHPTGQDAAQGNSLLVTFDLTPSGDGTLLKFTETGFRELGWETATLEALYNDHVKGWGHFLPRLAPYVATLRVRP